MKGETHLLSKMENVCDSCQRTLTTQTFSLLCGKCKSATYCSKECQRVHWHDSHMFQCEAKVNEDDGFLSHLRPAVARTSAALKRAAAEEAASTAAVMAAKEAAVKIALKLVEAEANTHRTEIEEITRLSERRIDCLRQELSSENDTLRAEIEIAREESKKFKALYLQERTRNIALHQKITDILGRFRVAVRVKPPPTTTVEPAVKAAEIMLDSSSTERMIKIKDRSAYASTLSFKCDEFFESTSTNLEIFKEQVEPLVGMFLKGVDVCIAVYGQTGSGKTHTLSGSNNDPGINLLSMASCFERDNNDPTTCRKFKISYAELYNESFYDLLRSEEAQCSARPLELHATTDGVEINGLTSIELNEEEGSRIKIAEKIIALGNQHRKNGSHSMNTSSSRGHAILTLKCTHCRYDGNGEFQESVSKFTLVDLAGSERIKRTGATGERLSEAKSINQSLSALGDVVYSLATKKEHIPFRNNKLTHLLQDTMNSPSARVLIICTLSSESRDAHESICTMEFAQRCRCCERRKDSKHRKLKLQIASGNSKDTTRSLSVNTTSLVSVNSKKISQGSGKENSEVPVG